MKNIFTLYRFISIIGLFFTSCETINLDQTENPSTLNESFLDPYFTFNYVQIKLADFVDSSNSFTQRVTRQMAMTGGNTYDNAFAPVNFDSNWSTGYGILNAIKIMQPKAQANNQYYELGASKVIRCYVLMTLVDMYGDIPYSESLQGNANITPKYDNSAAVYKGILSELDEAISILSLTGDKSEDSKRIDLYYSSKANWITLAKTLKLKMFVNARLAASDLGLDIGSSIKSIYDQGDYIKNSDQDFAFKYSNSRSLPNSRHPLYNDQYELGGGAYISNYFMWAMTTEKRYIVTLPNGLKLAAFAPTLSDASATYDAISNTWTTQKPNDPRLHFYFFKQKAKPSDYQNNTFTLPGRSRPSHFNDYLYSSFYDHNILAPYVVSNWVSGSVIPNSQNNQLDYGDGFWGRDHGDNSGLPPDAEYRTVGGIYPIGGAYGDAKSVQTSGVAGLKGAGIMPILLSSYVHFMLSEASLTVSGFYPNIARNEFQLGINQSISKVTNFGKSLDGYPDDKQLTTARIKAIESNSITYSAFMLSKYDSLSGSDLLELVIKEYYIAAWGNGIEPYNNYRRTGFPSNFQPSLISSIGNFYSCALYPAVAVNNNPNTPNNLRTRKVFWDKANVNLH